MIAQGKKEYSPVLDWTVFTFASLGLEDGLFLVMETTQLLIDLC
jgi:hypothetical protein